MDTWCFLWVWNQILATRRCRNIVSASWTNFVYKEKLQTLPGVRNFKLCNFRRKKFFNAKRNLKIAAKFSFHERKRSETNLMEEYCWAIAKAEGQSCCGRSGSGVLEFGFQLNSYTYDAPHVYSIPTCEKLDLSRISLGATTALRLYIPINQKRVINAFSKLCYNKTWSRKCTLNAWCLFYVSFSGTYAVLLILL